MAMDWKLALPLHPEYRTLPMVWYVPPLSPIQSYADAGGLPMNDGVLPAVETCVFRCSTWRTCSAQAIPARCCAP
jgi:nitrate reductase beta subunit